jgi:oligopeptide transport system ATP-binding protein
MGETLVMPHDDPVAPLLSVENLSVAFRGEHGVVRALDSVNLEVRAGETLAVVGESGSGKSVTALSILGLLADNGRVESGRILFEGRDLLSLAPDALRAIRGRHISMIFQEPMSSLNPVLTIGRQVAEPIWLHEGKPWDQALDRAAELLNMVSIPDARERLGQYPHHFSGGMRQRVMIAMALACRPRLIIADEPTTALDVTVQAQILELLKNLTRDTGAALILITHDLGIVARYAQRVAVMYAGRIVESADARTLYSNPQHPYTRGLLASVPSLTGTPGARLFTIAGHPPDLARLPPGCAFAPRCPHAHAACTGSVPVLEPVAPGHLRACIGHD